MPYTPAPSFGIRLNMMRGYDATSFALLDLWILSSSVRLDGNHYFQVSQEMLEKNDFELRILKLNSVRIMPCYVYVLAVVLQRVFRFYSVACCAWQHFAIILCNDFKAGCWKWHLSCAVLACLCFVYYLNYSVIYIWQLNSRWIFFFNQLVGKIG